MIYLIVYLLACLALFVVSVYAMHLRNDLRFDDLMMLLVMSFIPLLNFAVLSAAYDELRKYTQLFSFLDKVIIKMKQ